VSKIKTYIIQALSIVLLLHVYFLSVQSEKEYDMHYDVSPYTSTHIAKASKSRMAASKHIALKTKNQKNNKSTRKLHIVKHITLKLSIPEYQAPYPTYVFASILHTSRIRDTYHYLFSREINPPPPKFANIYLA